MTRRSGGTAAAGGAITVARLLRTAVSIIAGIIVIAILLRLLGANGHNGIVHDIHELGRDLVGPFNNLFSIHDAKLAIVVNWGIAAACWAVIGGAIASAIARAGVSRTV